MISKKNIVYLILGLGLGIIITNILHSTYPKIEFLELDDNAIIERARDLGMVPIKEAIKVDKETVEPEDDKLEETAEEIKDKLEDLKESETEEIIEELAEVTTEGENLEEILVVIESGMFLTQVSEVLYDNGLIEDEFEFSSLVRANDLSKKITAGKYKIKKASSYGEIIKLLTGVNPQTN